MSTVIMEIGGGPMKKHTVVAFVSALAIAAGAVSAGAAGSSIRSAFDAGASYMNASGAGASGSA